MDITIQFDEQALAEAIVNRMNRAFVAGGGAAAEEDDFGAEATKQEEEKPTLETVHAAISAAMKDHGKDALKALVEKVAKVKKVADIPEDKFQAVLDGIAKLKKK